ncbi:MAG: hypothetical protein ACM3SR_08020 [Ignavibacteriales bacterium]
MDLEARIRRLEGILGDHKVSWKLMDGTEVEAYSDDILVCLGAAIRRKPQLLLEKIRGADLSTYSGDDSLLGLIQALLRSREVYQIRGT